MVDFQELAELEDFKRIYERALEFIALVEHPEFFQRPIKVLDIGGCVGTIGDLLRKQCENTLGGEIADEEFLELVDYVNVDIDEEALAHSIGRAINENSAHLYEKFCSEQPFDYILSLNYAPDFSLYSYTPKDLDNMEMEDDFMGYWSSIRSNMLNAANNLKQEDAAIQLINTALLLREGGKYIRSAIITEDNIHHMKKYISEHKLGLRIISKHKQSFNDSTVKAFAQYDAEKAGVKKTRRFIKDYKDEYRFVIMDSIGIADGDKAIRLLNQHLECYNAIKSFCRSQEMFFC